ncbi:hypothetical protein NM208_g5892 [Fusarium decemcellulare]|uniref:Uncharacterized protein n=1 Tax=Fusarium decemcellulare TaxID=57161 RepID=A0ACC1SFB9_9HYPO|nr:hypothetical protein NM208_g5892 [Fusarium decemcellulare]
MEPVGLALAVVPLIGSSIAVFKEARSKLKIFCHYSAEVKRVRKRFGIQRDIFVNEIEILFSAALNNKLLAKRLVEDTTDSEWKSRHLEEKLKDYIGRSWESFCGVIEDIEETSIEFNDALKCFRALEYQKQENESLTDAVKRLRGRIKLPFKKQDFDDWTKQLTKSNAVLHRLCSQSHYAGPEPSCIAETSLTKYSAPNLQVLSFGSVQKASRALYETLSGAWSRMAEKQPRHSVQLFLDAEGLEEVNMNLAIRCYGHQLMQNVAVTKADLIQLHVRSRSLESLTQALTTSLSTLTGSMPTDSGFSENDYDKRFQGLQLASSATLATDNLAQSRDICREFLHRKISSATQDPGNTKRMDDILSEPIDNNMSIIHQLQLALQVALAVLKFNSTPWLSDYWSARDLYFIQGNQVHDLSASLETLHLEVDITEHQNSETTLGDISESQLLDEAKWDYGIRNIALYSLGAILLAIGRWERVDLNDVGNVRRLAAGPCKLGPKYQRLTEKVLDCDFGLGKDLRQPELQEAVYEKVVLELELMIEGVGLASQNDRTLGAEAKGKGITVS